MTLQELKEKFVSEGKTFASWSRENNVRYSTTLAVINGTNKGNYGEAHRVAVALGLKEAA
jgi:gp16 family phage-associated protein